MPGPDLIFRFNGRKTLPIYYARARLTETLRPFESAKCEFEYADPNYKVPRRLISASFENIARDPKLAVDLVNSWITHHGDLCYFIQFSDEGMSEKFGALDTHTALISSLCDARLQIDPSSLWKSFDRLYRIRLVHSDYRKDPEGMEKWADYAERLHEVHKNDETPIETRRLIDRIVRQIEIKSSIWSSLPGLYPAVSERPAGELRLFYSYSHKDESLRDELETHLSILKRQGAINSWHDRKIMPGQDWKGKIDANLEDAQIVLLLISADFLASDYCYDVELKRALERQLIGSACVIPVILRACDWTAEPTISKLQALPKDAQPVMSWGNKDEAFTDIAKGIRAATELFRSKVHP